MKVEDFKDIIYHKDDNGIVTVTINTPKRKNSMSSLTFFEVRCAVDALVKDETAHLMILTGAKDPNSYDPKKEAFSSGAYFNPDALDGVSDEIKAQIDFKDIAQAELVLKMWQCDKPIIAAINGLVIGGAFTMCMSGCDLIYCSEHAWASLPFVGLGIIPELASTFLMPRLIGLQRTKEFMFFGERYTAQQLFELGIANKVLPHDQLLPYVREKAMKLIPPNAPAFAVRTTKQTINKPLIEAVRTALGLENKGLQVAMASADFKEGQKARMEKRAPVFTGK